MRENALFSARACSEFVTRYMDGYARANRLEASGIASNEWIIDIHLVPHVGALRLDAITDEKVQKLKTISRDPVSLETPVGRDGESALGDLIEDRWVGSPVDAVIESNVRDETAGILKTLSPKEEKVIRMRFGIGCEREHTLEEIGQEFDVTRERIRQIEAKALRQLRAPERARRLRALMAAR